MTLCSLPCSRFLDVMQRFRDIQKMAARETRHYAALLKTSKCKMHTAIACLDAIF